MSQITYPLGLPKELLKQVKDAAKETGLSTADVMRQAIKFGVPMVRQRMSVEEDFSEAAADTWEKLGPPPKVRFVKRGRYRVGESDRPVDMNAVKELLSEFP